MISFFDMAKNYLPETRKYWADYIFHFSDMKNIVRVLKSGKLYSRNNAIKYNLMQNDNASKEVIDQTNYHVHDYVRFYFRPLTPTQYNNEGLKKGNPKDKHCPIPVFLLFDNSIIEHHTSECILCQKTLASTSSLGLVSSDINDLNSFPYDKIYHVGPYDSILESDIKQYRQAEFCVKNQVGLEDLKYIVTRSYAEKEMLLYWLNSLNIDKYNDIIKCSIELGFQSMFYKQNLFIDNVDLADDYFKFQVMNYSIDYDFKILIKCDNDNNRIFEFEVKNNKFEIDFPDNSYKNNYKVKLVVDNEVMFVGFHNKSKKSEIIF